MHKSIWDSFGLYVHVQNVSLGATHWQQGLGLPPTPKAVEKEDNQEVGTTEWFSPPNNNN